MKKILSFFLAFVLLCGLMILPPAGTVEANAETVNAFVGSSLYIDDQVDLKLFFDPSLIQSGTFTLTTDFNGKTYTAADLVDQTDVNGKVTYKVLTVGPFSATKLGEKYTYSGSHMTPTSFSLVDKAQSDILYYVNYYANNAAVQDIVKFLKAFVNYGVSVQNYLDPDNKTLLPYEVSYTDPNFSVHPGILYKADGTTVSSTTPLTPERSITGRSFTLSEDVYLVYQGAIQTPGESKNWTVSVNGKILFVGSEVKNNTKIECSGKVNDTTSRNDCSFTENGETFTVGVPIHADQGAEGLRVIIRSYTKENGKEVEKTIFDCVDRADQVATTLKNFEKWEELSGSLTAYLQAASAYAYSANPMMGSFKNDTFYAGYGEVDISPYASAVQLNSAKATEFIDPIKASCVALRDPDGKTILIYSIDIRNIQSGRNDMYSKMKNLVTTATGIPADQIFFNATHTHSAPSVSSTDSTVTAWANDYFYPRLPAAAKKALEDLTPVDGAYAGETKTDLGTNYNRRYWTGTGNQGVYDSGRSGYEDYSDKTLRTIRFDRESGKDILLVNWQCHAAHGGGANPSKGSADFIAQLRLVVEKDTAKGGMGMHLLYINGASGDLNMTELGQSTAPDYMAKGLKVAQTIKELVGSRKEKSVALGKINVMADTLESDLHYRNHADGTYCYDANCITCKAEYISLKNTGWSASGLFNSSSQYNTFIDQKNGANLAYHHREINLWTVTIGDSLGFAFVPYEMFNQNGVALRNAVNEGTEGGKTIFTAGYTNGYLGYMPSEKAWAKVDAKNGADDGALEVHTTHYVRGTAERCIEKLSKNLISQFN